MEITLTPATQKLLDAQMTRGGYESPDELVRAALEALGEQQALVLDEASLNAIDRAEDQIERGEFHALDDVRDRIRNRFLGR